MASSEHFRDHDFRAPRTRCCCRLSKAVGRLNRHHDGVRHRLAAGQARGQIPVRARGRHPSDPVEDRA